MKIIAITPGEPAGIGLDIVIQHAQQSRAMASVVFCDPEILQERAAQLKLPIIVNEWRNHGDVIESRAQYLSVYPVAVKSAVIAGQLNVANSPYVISCLDAAIDFCQHNIMNALVTGPVNKAIINQAAINFQGHTEYLATRCQVDRTVMMFATPECKVALQTTHIPLNKVSHTITRENVQETIFIFHHALQHMFGISDPRIAICGLNPHAGENGYLGREEIDIIEPAIAFCAARGMKISGPVSADTAFISDNLKKADGILAMYHDQALPVVKYAYFEKAVNVTLGLPIIRTSVDHGTALPLAATGKASAVNFEAAFALAASLINVSKRGE